jgi:hypothetical protein
MDFDLLVSLFSYWFYSVANQLSAHISSDTMSQI